MADLGAILLSRGLVTPEKLQASIFEQSVTKEQLGKILVRNGFVRQDSLFRILREVDPNALHDEAVFQSVIPPEVLLETRTMVAATVEGTLYLSTLSSPAWVRRMVEPYVAGRPMAFTAANPVRLIDYLRQLRETHGAKKLTWEKIFYDAMRARASDIHLQPRAYSYSVHLRLDGVRQPVHEGTLEEYIGLVTRVKDLAKMDMAERRRPQDGGFSMEYSGRVVNFRVATVPTRHGEKMVVRILDPDAVNLQLDQLGISLVDTWRISVNKTSGLCLVCGPTGSGKTTTLSSTVREMNFLERAIYTVEDPVEYDLPYAAQVSVNETVGLDFSAAVRAFMRADPDVIVVGEVRDLETARNALKAAETGHLTIATLHTDSVISAIGRLRDIGIQPYELRHLLRGVLVQRLVRVYCSHCSGTGQVLHRHAPQGTKCPVCSGVGFKGREVISELANFENEDDVDAVINGKVSWKTIDQDAKSKVLAGRTSAQEVYRVVGKRLESIPDYVEPAAK
ncbi:GspE/PulE family protein [Comamonas thiooxydans]|uniref:GspE/PulE family protein n=1 Tax=Comamonas thiooxydans TaxID=363952 RepID=UPI000B418561|nr:GspE/PulE family protein [Comamonas thiooxydans]